MLELEGEQRCWIGVSRLGRVPRFVVATEHDNVYAIDADSGFLLWTVSLLSPGETPADTDECDPITPEGFVWFWGKTPPYPHRRPRHPPAWVVCRLQALSRSDRAL
jgi:hypothetical protein